MAAAACVLLAARVGGGSEPPAVQPAVQPAAQPAAFKLIRMEDLPDFKSELEEKATKKGRVHTNGLVATVNYQEYKEPKIDGEVKVKLSASCTGFKDELEVRTLWQSHPAPMAVLLLGFYESHDDTLARTWKTYLYQTGCHVLTFDSVFRNGFNKHSGHGVPGNLKEEAKVVVRLIDALLAQEAGVGQPSCGQRVTSVRLLGTSYGGSLALHVLKLPRAKTWSIDRALALSPLVKFSTSMRRIDRFYEVDAAKFQTSFLKLLGGYTPDKDQPNEREMALMRAGIGWDFHATLKDVLKYSEEAYLPGLFNILKQQEEEPERKGKYESQIEALKAKQEIELMALKTKCDTGAGSQDEYKAQKKELKERQQCEMNQQKKKLSSAGDWNFQDFAERLCAPYWKLKLEELLAQGILETQLEGAPEFTQVVLATDDPLNQEDELAALRKKIPEPRLLVLPHGGHLGYAGTQWIKALLTQYFKAAGGQAP